jgi:hypothetical protein
LKNLTGDSDFPPFQGDVGAALSRGTAHRHQGLVLVSVGETPEDPERMAFKSVPSVVRLFILDDGLGMRREGTNAVVATGAGPHAAEIGDPLGNGEASISRRPPSCMARGDQPNQMIESAVQVMGDLANEQAPAGVWKLADDDSPDILPRLVVALMPVGIGFSVEEGPGFLPQDTQVVVRPRDLGGNRPNRMV